jgi:hypothetical protein
VKRKRNPAPPPNADADIPGYASPATQTIAIALRLGQSPFALPEHQDKGGAQADDDAQEDEGEGGGGECVQHSEIAAIDVPAPMQKRCSLDVENTEAAFIIPKFRYSAPGSLQFRLRSFADVNRPDAPAG